MRRGAGNGAGALGSGLPAWPQDAAPATAGRGVPVWHAGQRGQRCPARQIASFPCQFWERGARRGNSGLGHMALAGLSPARGGAAASRRAGVARQPSRSKPPAAPRPAGTTQGTATPGRRGAAGGCLCRGADGARGALQGCEREEGKQHGHGRSVNGTPKPGLLLPGLGGVGSIQVPSACTVCGSALGTRTPPPPCPQDGAELGPPAPAAQLERDRGLRKPQRVPLPPSPFPFPAPSAAAQTSWSQAALPGIYSSFLPLLAGRPGLGLLSAASSPCSRPPAGRHRQHPARPRFPPLAPPLPPGIPHPTRQGTGGLQHPAPSTHPTRRPPARGGEALQSSGDKQPWCCRPLSQAPPSHCLAFAPRGALCTPSSARPSPLQSLAGAWHEGRAPRDSTASGPPRGRG